jgi:hypothetical protein
MGDTNKSFKFQLVIPVEGDAHDIEAGTTYTGIKTGDDNEITFTVKNKADLGTDENIFYLKSGEEITINLPEGTIYTIEELDADDYKTDINAASVSTSVNKSASLTNNKVFDAKANNLPIVEGGNTVEYVNTKDMTATGLVIEYLPHLVVLLIAACGALVIFKTRRRVER